MRAKWLTIFIIAGLFFGNNVKGQLTKGRKMNTLKSSPQSGVFPLGKKYKSDKFTGKVWLRWLSEPDKVFNCPMCNVTFEPGCRNNWHKHSGGQILLATGGKGYYQEKGKPAQLLLPGDAVRIKPDVVHWHGAAPDAWFAHIAVETNPSDKGAVEWLEPVTDEQYKEATAETSSKCKINEAARINHDLLLPNYKSKLKITDPELIEIFDNFAFDEVLQHGNLDVKTRQMLILASNIACQALSEYKVMLKGALNVGVSPVEIKEILYQAVPYVGIAKALDFIYATNEILAAQGVELPLPPRSTTSPETRYKKGFALQKKIFGEMIDKMYESFPKDQLHIAGYLSDNCFGDYYTRKGLDIETRELLTFAMLMSMGGCESQLKGHIKGNRNLGNDRKILLAAATQLLPYVGYPRTLNAIRCINEIMPE